MEIILRIASTIAPIALLAFIFWYLVLAPNWVRSLIEYLFEKIHILLLWVVSASIEIVNTSVHFFHWIGRVFVVIIFLGATITLLDNIAVVLDIKLLNHSGVIFKLTRLFENRITWVASTAIVATTVALGHFKTIDFNYEKHRQEKLKEYREKRDKDKNT